MSEHLPRAIASGVIKLADQEVECAVLENGQRVLSQRGFARVLGRGRGGEDYRRRKAQDGGGEPPVFLAANNLKPFIPNKLMAVENVIPYAPEHGGRAGLGLSAEFIIDVCRVWIDASNANALKKSQIHIAERAKNLVAGLDYIGLVGLIDEATGYQSKRAHNELQALLNAYVLPEHRPYVEEIPIEFTKEIYRVYGWTYSADNRGPRYAAKFLRKVIYEQLPNPVLPKLDKSNPANEKWQRKKKHFTLLTENVGMPHFRSQLAGVMALLRATPAKNKRFFWTLFERAYGKQQSLDLGDDEF